MASPAPTAQTGTTGKSMAHSANNARRALHSVAELLDGLHRRGLNLQSATQADIDSWFAQPGAACWLARPFLAWAHQRRHLSRQIQLPPTPAATQPATDDTARWEIARRLVNDNALAGDDRVAAALVVLYGQPLSRIVRLTTDHIHTGSDGTVTVDLDGRQMPIHEPFATLIRQLPLRRTHGPADQIASRWLFPGRHAGQPLGAVVLGNRMRAIGVESQHAQQRPGPTRHPDTARRSRTAHRHQPQHRQPVGHHHQQQLERLRRPTKTSLSPRQQPKHQSTQNASSPTPKGTPPPIPTVRIYNFSHYCGGGGCGGGRAG